MADVVDAAARSQMMSGIRGKNTKPELLVRTGLHALGFRYRLRKEFWQQKIDTNRARDAKVDELFAERALRRLEIWECAFRGPGRIGLEETLARTAEWLRGNDERGEIRGTI